MGQGKGHPLECLRPGWGCQVCGYSLVPGWDRGLLPACHVQQPWGTYQAPSHCAHPSTHPESCA